MHSLVCMYVVDSTTLRKLVFTERCAEDILLPAALCQELAAYSSSPSRCFIFSSKMTDHAGNSPSTKHSHSASTPAPQVMLLRARSAERFSLSRYNVNTCSSSYNASEDPVYHDLFTCENTIVVLGTKVLYGWLQANERPTNDTGRACCMREDQSSGFFWGRVALRGRRVPSRVARLHCLSAPSILQIPERFVRNVIM